MKPAAKRPFKNSSFNAFQYKLKNMNYILK